MESTSWANAEEAAENSAVQTAIFNFWFIWTGFDFLGTNENGFFFRKNKIPNKKAFRLRSSPIISNVELSPILQQFPAMFCLPDFPAWHLRPWTHNLLCPQIQIASQRPRNRHRPQGKRPLLWWLRQCSCLWRWSLRQRFPFQKRPRDRSKE